MGGAATILRAVSVSAPVPALLNSGQAPVVLGVSAESLNFLANGAVISLVPAVTGNLPRGVLVDLPRGFSWKATGIAPGDAVTADGNTLVLTPALALDLTSAAVWQPRRRLSSLPVTSHHLRAGVAAGVTALAGGGGLAALAPRLETLAQGGIVPQAGDLPLHLVALPHLNAMYRGALAADEARLLQGARGLVGLGIGLTPSGDDVLTGFFGSLVLLADLLPEWGWIRRAAAVMAGEAEGRTTLVSLTYLRCAAAGEIAEIQERLLVALLAGEGQAAVAACRKLLAFGHSSGSEIALGTLMAVDLVARSARA